MPSERLDANAWAVDELPPGAVIAGRYRIEHTLGSGGMGVVLAAEHIALGQRVAIKFMLPEATKDAAAVGRFTREAWAASRISSEYVTRVFDLGELPGGAPYIVMEYLEGSDLARRLRDEGTLPLQEAVEFALQTCEALAEAHALGIVHRDLKPSNLFCVQRSDGLASIKVLDFGISKFTRAEHVVGDLSLTSTKSIIGSPFYMSPEQMGSAKNADVRADIWALGVMLYEMLGGELPFKADTLPELAVCVATESPKPLHSLRADLPRGLSNVVARCLEKQRDKRYRDIAELARALAQFGPARAREHAERAARVLERANTAKRPAVVAAHGGGGATTRHPSRGRGLARATLIAGVVVAAAGAVGVWLWSSSQPEAEGPLLRPAAPRTAESVSASSDTPPPSAAAPSGLADAPSPAAREASRRAGAAPPSGAQQPSDPRARLAAPSTAAASQADTHTPASTSNQETTDSRSRAVAPSNAPPSRADARAPASTPNPQPTDVHVRRGAPTSSKSPTDARATAATTPNANAADEARGSRRPPAAPAAPTSEPESARENTAAPPSAPARPAHEPVKTTPSDELGGRL